MIKADSRLEARVVLGVFVRFAFQIVGALLIAVAGILGIGPADWITALLVVDGSTAILVIRVALLVLVVVAGWYVFMAPALASSGRVICPWQYKPLDTDWVPIRLVIGLDRAAQLARDRVRGRTPNDRRLAADAARRLGGGQELAWFANALTDDGQVLVYGRTPGSRQTEVVSPELMKYGHLRDDGRVIGIVGSDDVEFEGLAIKWADYRRRIKEIENLG